MWLFNRSCRCDTGELLNPLMHVFIFVQLVFGSAFLFFGDTNTVQSSVLYQQTLSWGPGTVNMWGLIGFLVPILHLFGVVIRGKFGIQLMRLALAGGFFIWLWAVVLYVQDDFWFQLLAGAVPNLSFWIWYAWQWYIRYKHPYDATVKAFV